MENKEYTKECPKCGKEIFYTTEKILKASIRDNKMCKSCSLRKRYSDPREREKASIATVNRYITNPLLREKTSIAGIKHFSDPKEREKTSKISKKIWSNLELRKKASDKSIKFYSNPEEIKKMSEAVKVALHRPNVRKKHIEALVKVNYLGKSVDIGFTEMINCWNKIGFNFISNYQLHTDDFLCYLDGYDKEKNVVLEYDSKYHNKLNQQQKDLIRQNKIIELLKPKKFWRYNAVNKTCKNVLEN